MKSFQLIERVYNYVGKNRANLVSHFKNYSLLNMHTVVFSDLVEIPEIEGLIRKMAHLKSENMWIRVHSR